MLFRSPFVILNVKRPDFTTATRITNTINKLLGPKTATAMDAVSIKVNSPLDPSRRVAFLSFLENINVVPGDSAAKIIINSRTGTIVIGKHVMVTEAAVTHGSLTVTISEQPKVSQPNSFSRGTTTVVPRSGIKIDQEKSRMFLFKTGVSLKDIVRAVNRVGAAPGDLVAILEALKQAGALRAELVII